MANRIAAQVVLSATGRQDTQRVLLAFQALGFQTGALVGGSFAIEADIQGFSQVFGVTPTMGSDGRISIGTAVADAGAAQGLLPLTQLPASLQPLLSVVLFTPPPAFGPTGGFGAGY